MAQIIKAKRKTQTNYKFNKMANNQIRPREDNMKWPNVVWTRDEWAKSYKNMFKNISRKKINANARISSSAPRKWNETKKRSNTIFRRAEQSEKIIRNFWNFAFVWELFVWYTSSSLKGDDNQQNVAIKMGDIRFSSWARGMRKTIPEVSYDLQNNGNVALI